jgi:hypothetical protein
MGIPTGLYEKGKDLISRVTHPNLLNRATRTILTLTEALFALSKEILRPT